jgi:hydrogenase/urease accessory protein HupE
MNNETLKTVLEWLDDKTQVIVAILILVGILSVTQPEIVTENLPAVLTGLFGIVTGHAMGKGQN